MDGTFTMKIDYDTELKLIEIAKKSERTKSAMIRHLIRDEYKRVNQDQRGENDDRK